MAALFPARPALLAFLGWDASPEGWEGPEHSCDFSSPAGLFQRMPLLDALSRDLRLAFRGLARDRGFTVAALLTFALCLGANVALFAVVNAVLIRPLPYPNPRQIVTVFNQYPKAGVDRAGASVPHYLERRAGIAAFADAGAYKNGGVTLGEAGSPDRVESM